MSAPAPVQWTPCGSGLDCGTVEVPLDYAHPGSRKVPIALQRRRATGLRLGSLLLNPGGPGESGIASMDFFVKILSPTLLDRFDLVAFDPRGVGDSEGVQCLDGPSLDRYFDLDPTPTTPVGLSALVAADQGFAAGCRAHSGDLLPFVGTMNAARDMDLIREALGEPKLTYFGFSYGSLLGDTYADLFPTHIRAMVLDGAIDPSLDPVTVDDQQAIGFDHALTAFFADCASSPTCAWRPGGDLRAAFDRLMASIRAHPLHVATRMVGPGEAFLGVATPLYDRSAWPLLAEALQAASEGDGSGLLRLFDTYAQRQPDGSYAHTLEADTAISCADQTWPTDPAAYPALAAAAAKLAPEFGPANVYSSLVCAFWPVHGTLPPHRITAAGSPPILVVGSTGDPATPYAWAQSVAAQLQHGVLLTRQGEGHTGYDASACIRGHVDAYLVDGTLPPAGTVCAS